MTTRSPRGRSFLLVAVAVANAQSSLLAAGFSPPSRLLDVSHDGAPDWSTPPSLPECSLGRAFGRETAVTTAARSDIPPH